jgi:hypothetical protein
MSSPQVPTSISDFYWPLEDAIKELERRRESPALEKKVRESLNLTPELEVLFERPHLIMFRQVVTPLIETLLFLDLAKRYNLHPFIIEYYDDKFVSSGNPFKRSLGKLPIYQFTDKNKDEVIKYKTIIDFNTQVGHPINTIRTLTGESLIKFHHDLFYSVTGKNVLTISRDGSSWFKRYSSSCEYYDDFLKLFIRDNILFETFITEGTGKEFTDKIVLPAFHKNIELFNLNPLLVKADYSTTIDSRIVDLYPKDLCSLI